MLPVIIIIIIKIKGEHRGTIELFGDLIKNSVSAAGKRLSLPDGPHFPVFSLVSCRVECMLTTDELPSHSR